MNLPETITAFGQYENDKVNWRFENGILRFIEIPKRSRWFHAFHLTDDTDSAKILFAFALKDSINGRVDEVGWNVVFSKRTIDIITEFADACAMKMNSIYKRGNDFIESIVWLWPEQMRKTNREKVERMCMDAIKPAKAAFVEQVSKKLTEHQIVLCEFDDAFIRCLEIGNKHG